MCNIGVLICVCERLDCTTSIRVKGKDFIYWAVHVASHASSRRRVLIFQQAAAGESRCVSQSFVNWFCSNGPTDSLEFTGQVPLNDEMLSVFQNMN